MTTLGFALDTLSVVSLLSAAVVWAIHFSQELLALDGPTMAGFGTILVALGVSVERWVR